MLNLLVSVTDGLLTMDPELLTLSSPKDPDSGTRCWGSGFTWLLLRFGCNAAFEGSPLGGFLVVVVVVVPVVYVISCAELVLTGLDEEAEEEERSSAESCLFFLSAENSDAEGTTTGADVGG